MKTKLDRICQNMMWTFDGEKYPSQQLFEEALKTYTQELDSEMPELVKISLKKIEVLLEYVDEEDVDHELLFTLQPDNDAHFTNIELLYKINEHVTSVLADMDKHFFEGLSLMEANNPPLYSLDLGS